MALAYHILAHKNPAQVRRLFQAIFHEDDTFVLHFDRRAPAALHKLGRELRKAHPNVILQHSERVLWGGPQIPDLQITAMAQALARSQGWSHFINLSGQDFPLRPRSEILTLLQSEPSTNFVNWFDPLTTHYWSNAKSRLARWYLHWPWLHSLLEIRGIGRRLKKLAGWANQFPSLPGYHRAEPKFFRYFGGSNHAVLSRAACSYIESDPCARRIRRWLSHSAIPDESIFQSVLLNSPLASTIVNHHRRYFEFSPGTPHPRTFRLEDFDLLIKSDAWFARKFDEAVDAQILDRLEQHVREAPQRA
jgi:hypothetical protein